MASQPKARLDMGHGFMKCIIKNQVERDNYDKEVKAKLNEKPKLVGHKARKPEIQTYVPPSRFKPRSELERAVLFDLEFEDQHGEIHRLPINKGDNIVVMAHKFGQQVGLTEPYIQALTVRLQEEVERRQNGKVP